jgi:hypothetical protein
LSGFLATEASNGLDDGSVCSNGRIIYDRGKSKSSEKNLLYSNFGHQKSQINYPGKCNLYLRD